MGWRSGWLAETEVAAAEDDGYDPELLRPISLHQCRHTFHTTFDVYGHLLPGSHDAARVRMGRLPAEGRRQAMWACLRFAKVGCAVMHEDALREEFTHQAASFGQSPAMTSAQTLGALVELVPEDPQARWLDVACGPGVVSRAMATKVGSVTGVDLTPAMIEEATKRASEEGVENVSYSVGDATALDIADDAFDGAITRLSLHHVPAAARIVTEMARVVRPRGVVVVSDLAGDRDWDVAAWREEIERLRDPSHWICLTPERLGEAGAAAGLVVDQEEIVPVDIDFDDWLARGSNGHAAAGLIDQLLADRPPGATCFRVVSGGSGRRLLQDYWLCRWRRPE